MKITRVLSLILIAIFALTSCHKKNDPGPATSSNAPTQWARLNSLPNENITALEIINNVIYAASSTSRKVYISADNGATWTASSQINQGKYISALTVFKNKIYVGMDLDMYSSSNNGQTWADEGNIATVVTSFATSNNNLYCSSYQNGILMLDSNTNKWQSFSNGLTSEFDHLATKVLTVNNTLLGTTGYSFATLNATQQAWFSNNYYNHAANPIIWWPNYTIDMVYNQGTILSQVYMSCSNQQTIMHSDDLGSTWYPDALNLRSDINKYTIHGLLVGSSKYYSISNQDTISIGTWVQQRDRSAPLGSTWANGEEFLPSIYSSAIREYNGTLFLATSAGLYFKKV